MEVHGFTKKKYIKNYYIYKNKIDHFYLYLWAYLNWEFYYRPKVLGLWEDYLRCMKLVELLLFIILLLLFELFESKLWRSGISWSNYLFMFEIFSIFSGSSCFSYSYSYFNYISFWDLRSSFSFSRSSFLFILKKNIIN